MNLRDFCFENIVFMQGEEADAALALLDDKGAGAVFEYLLQWDNGDGGDVTRPPYSPSWGTSDTVYPMAGRYYVTVNTGLGYIGLCRRMSRAEESTATA